MERSSSASVVTLADDRARHSAGTYAQVQTTISQQFLALSMIGLGVLGFIYGDVALVVAALAHRAHAGREGGGVCVRGD